MPFADFINEAKGRGIRTSVCATQAKARDARGRRMDLLSSIRRTNRMGYTIVPFTGYSILVGSTLIRFMDISRPISSVD